MVRFFKQLYLTGFTVGFRLRMPERLGGGWGPIIDAGKGILVVSLIAFINLTNIADWIEIHNETRFSFDSDPWVTKAAVLALYLMNYYVLVTRGHGIKFEREFNHLEKSRKILLLVSFGVLLLATVAFSIYSISAHQRFFHIIPKT